MADPGDSQHRADAARRRRVVILSTAVVLATVVAIGLALFQPWKLWVDDTIDEAAPVGAVPITAPVVATESSTRSLTVPTTGAPTATTTAGPQSTAPRATAPARTVAPTTVAPTTIAPTAPPANPVGGNFVSIDHDTSGTVVLLQDASGAQFVRLENLDTSNGPDLFVYLSTNPPDGPEEKFDDDYVDLGRLQGNVGSSNYAIPAGTELSRYASVAIWCDRFNSGFGAAPLR